MYRSFGWPEAFRADEFVVARDAYNQQIKDGAIEQETQLHGEL